MEAPPPRCSHPSILQVRLVLPDMYIDLFDGNFTTTTYWTTQGNCDVAYPPATFVWYTLAENCNNGVSAPPYRVAL